MNLTQLRAKLFTVRKKFWIALVIIVLFLAVIFIDANTPKSKKYESDIEVANKIQLWLENYLDETGNVFFENIEDIEGNQFVLEYNEEGLEHLLSLLATKFIIINQDGTKTSCGPYINIYDYKVDEFVEEVLNLQYTPSTGGIHVGYNITIYAKKQKVRVTPVSIYEEIGIKFK